MTVDKGSELAAVGLADCASARAVLKASERAAVSDDVPHFVVWAARGANSMALARLQIIKGWVAPAGPKEKLYDVACSDGLAVDPNRHRCPDNGAGVDLESCQPISGEGVGEGAAELESLRRDPDFDPRQQAFYYLRVYLRVLEHPTCRWCSWAALRSGVPVRPDIKAMIQERAWSSPIWIRPLS